MFTILEGIEIAPPDPETMFIPPLSVVKNKTIGLAIDNLNPASTLYPDKFNEEVPLVKEILPIPFQVSPEMCGGMLYVIFNIYIFLMHQS